MALRAAEIRKAFADLVHRAGIRHLAFVGAHEGEEVASLIAAGVQRLTLVEPLPDLAARLREQWPDLTVVEAACSDKAGTATLYVPARDNMASLIPLDGEPIEVPTVRLDEVAPDADAAVIDVQGHEYEVLAAAPWDSLRLLMVETCTIDDPTISVRYEPMVAYMASRGFRETARFSRDYDWIMRWAYGRVTATGAQVHDVVFARD